MGVVASRIYSQKLRGKWVFISASFPAQDRAREYFESANPFRIIDATIAVARAIFGASGGVLFGGHPTISPLILSVSREFLTDFEEKQRPYVLIYQSRFFQEEIPHETKELTQEGIGRIVWVEATPGNRDKSLWLMREAMLNRGPVAGIFIGGMEGVYREGDPESEFYMFRNICKGCPAYPIGTTGGASETLLQKLREKKEPMTWQWKRVTLDELAQPLAFNPVMRKVVEDIMWQT